MPPETETPDERAEREAREYLAQQYPNLAAQPAMAPASQGQPDNSAFNSAINSVMEKNQPSPVENMGKALVSNLPEIAGGAASGWALRKGIPSEIQYNPQQTKEDVNTINTQQEVQQARNALMQQNQAEHDRLEAIHNRNLQLQEQAAHEHAYAQTLTPEEIMQSKAMPAAAPELTEQPRGGAATSNYAMKFGATPEEANRIPSMSAMQQQNIPAQAQAWEKINNVAPGFGQYAESPLLLGVEGQEALKERMAEKMASENGEQSERKHAERHVAKHKAEAKLRLESAREAARRSADELAQAKKMLQPSPRDMAEEIHGANAAQQARERIQKQISPLGSETPSRAAQVLSWAGRKLLPRLVPGAGAAFAPIEFEKGMKQIHEGKPWQGAAHIVGGLGGVAQATNVPLLMGAGDVMQIAPLAAEVYEAFQKPNP